MKKFILKNDELPQNAKNYAIDYRKALNPQQLEAVMFDKGNALVIAGAGTGKTRTLVYRVARLVEDGVDPRKILLLTFTRRAAREMLQRASSILDDRCRSVQGGTFHFYCSQLLHKYASDIGYPANFTIIDTTEAVDIIQMLRSQLRLNKSAKRFPHNRTIHGIISSSANRQQSIHEIMDEQYPQFMEHIDVVEELAGKFDGYKKSNFVMDFDDLLHNTCHLLKNNMDVRDKIASGNQYVMVDEYQDINSVQDELVRLFSTWHGNVVAVGDDAQSIYSFRGADHENIMLFEEHFTNARIMKLEENYRSTGQILELANRLLEESNNSYNKKLFTHNEKGDLPALVKAPDERDQSRFLSQMILTLREQGYALNETAVLFRNSRDSYDLEIELDQKKIPYVKYGGQKFSEAAHIKDVLAHIRVIVNPMDAVAWNRLLMLLDGIGPKTAVDLIDWLKKQDNPYELSASQLVSERYIKQIHALSALLLDLRNGDHTVPESVQHVVDYYKPVCEKKYDDSLKRIRDLETFVGIAENFASLSKLLEELTLDPIDATVIDEEALEQDEPPLILSTIHSAKGLEWKNVFIIQCLDGIIPSGYSLDDELQLEEELRLLYVACTRPREHLYLTYPVIRNAAYGDYFSDPSRFIKDMKEDRLEPWILVQDWKRGGQLEDGSIGEGHLLG